MNQVNKTAITYENSVNQYNEFLTITDPASKEFRTKQFNFKQNIIDSYFNFFTTTIQHKLETILETTEITKEVDFRKRLDFKGLKNKYQPSFSKKEQELLNGIIPTSPIEKITNSVFEINDMTHLATKIIWDVLNITKIENVYLQTVAAIEEFTSLENKRTSLEDSINSTLNELVNKMRTGAKQFTQISNDITGMENDLESLSSNLKETHNNYKKAEVEIRNGKKSNTVRIRKSHAIANIKNSASDIKHLQSKLTKIYRTLLPGYLEVRELKKSVQTLGGNIVQTYHTMLHNSQQQGGFFGINQIKKFSSLKDQYQTVLSNYFCQLETLKTILSKHKEYGIDNLTKIINNLSKTGKELLDLYGESVHKGRKVEAQVLRIEASENNLRMKAITNLKQSVVERVNDIKSILPFSLLGCVDTRSLKQPHYRFFIPEDADLMNSYMLESAVQHILDHDSTLFNHPHTKNHGMPDIILIPSEGNGVYLTSLNSLLIPTVLHFKEFDGGNQTAIRSVANALAFYRLESDVLETKNIFSKGYASAKKIIRSKATTFFTKDYREAMVKLYSGLHIGAIKKSIGINTTNYLIETGVLPGLNSICNPHSFYYTLSTANMKKNLTH